MKLQMTGILLALFVSTSAFAFPKIGSKDTFTTTGKINGAPYSAISLIEEVTSIDEASNQISLKTSWMDNQNVMRDGTNTIKVSDVKSRYAVALNCSLEYALSLSSNDGSSGDSDSKITAAQPESIDTIFGNIPSCKITAQSKDGQIYSVWFIAQAFGAAKLTVSSQPDLVTTLTAYTE